MNHQRIILIIILLLAAYLKPSAQDFLYKFGYFGFFDNREYFNEYVNDQTIFGSRIYGELGYSFNENNRIMAGANYLYEFGNKGEWIAPDFTAYYYGKYKKLGFYMGAFPRVNKLSMPLALMNDTLQYYRPNIEGFLIEYRSGGLQHNLWMDWTGRQTMQTQEMFHVGFSGFVHKGLFIYQHHFVMTHLAHTLNQQVEEHIRDNAGLVVMPGLNLSKVTGLDTMVISAGILASYDRLRGIYSFHFPVGFYGEINALYKRIGIKSVVYAGEEQVITSGDGFYQSRFYCRADAYYKIANPYIDAKLQWSFHFIPKVIDVSMSLVVRAQLEGIFKHHHSN